MIAVGVVLVLASGWFYLSASSVPDRYQPLQLTQQQKDEVAGTFLPHVLKLGGDDAEKLQPFTWTITAKQLNEYLASMDEIAASLEGSRNGTVSRELDNVGLASPAVALDDGMVTLMVRQMDYQKVLSADIAIEFAPEEKLRVRLAGMRVGRLTVPQWMVDSYLRDLKDGLLAVLKNGGEDDASSERTDRRSQLSSKHVAQVMAVIIAAIDDEPIPTEFKWFIGKMRIRIRNIEVTKEQITLHLQPIERRKRGD